ncbi:MAG: aspartate/glutamate racemase family protein [Kiritimatiellia bacterium]|nr:amino acid racemase [Lentisphaerota bacterium]
MPSSLKKTIGILGGVGPEATAELFRRIIRMTGAQCDQDHLPVIIFNNPAIPDRTAAIIGRGASPLPALKDTARRLEKAGADCIAIPCNTAHFFLPQIRRAVHIPVLDMIDATAACIAAVHPGVRRVGLLATTGTVRSRLYHAALRRRRVRVIVPPASAQRDLVMAAIYGREGIKAGARRRPAQMLRQAAELLREADAGLLIAGCTEISMVLRGRCAGLPLVDPLTVLAREAIRQAGETSALCGASRIVSG